MSKKIKRYVSLLASISLLAVVCSCSVFISTPRTAKVCIQGLDDNYYEYAVALDAPVGETNLDIRISKHYAIQLDFEWLWESDTRSQLSHEMVDEDMPPPLVPWMLCKYRF